MKHIKTFESFKGNDQEMSEGAGKYTVITDKTVKQHFGKTIKEIQEHSAGGDEDIKIIFTDGSELEISVFGNDRYSSFGVSFS